MKHRMVFRSYGLSKTNWALNLIQWKSWARDNSNNNSDHCMNDPRTPNICVSNCLGSTSLLTDTGGGAHMGGFFHLRFPTHGSGTNFYSGRWVAFPEISYGWVP